MDWTVRRPYSQFETANFGQREQLDLHQSPRPEDEEREKGEEGTAAVYRALSRIVQFSETNGQPNVPSRP